MNPDEFQQHQKELKKANLEVAILALMSSARTVMRHGKLEFETNRRPGEIVFKKFCERIKGFGWKAEMRGNTVFLTPLPKVTS